MYQICAITLLFLTTFGFSQNFDFSEEWYSLGPNIPPKNKTHRSDAGIGPVEFIRIYPKASNHLLAGSLSGGLFYSDNGGENWVNTGSDKWDYSGAAWADFFPTDEKIWFGCSNMEGNNGKPGRLGKKGGIYRSKSKGEKWKMIGNYRDFGGSEYVVIYGTRFQPKNPNIMFVLTSDGLFYTQNCLAEFVSWIKVPLIDGEMYDLDFFQGKIYISNFYHGKWSIYSSPYDQIGKLKKIELLQNENRKLRNVTFEPADTVILVALDYKKSKDEILIYQPETGKSELLMNGQNISFGSGHTFAISPFNSSEFFFGYGTRVRKMNWLTKKKIPVSGKYHSDVEFVAYDPNKADVVYLATHGGVYKSEDGGKNWILKSNGLSIAEVMGLAVAKTDLNQIAIGCFHDGSMVRADFNQDGNYFWKMANGGDGLIPLIHPDSANIVYTSNQFLGGGLSFSTDTTRLNKNLHSINGLKTSGWEMAAFINPIYTNITYFNFTETKGDNKGNINICRNNNRAQKNSAQVISNFQASHQLKKYKVYGLFGSKYHPDELIAYVLNYEKDRKGNTVVKHLLFRTQKANEAPELVIDSWVELKHPNNNWIGDVEIDAFLSEKIYISYLTGKPSPSSVFGDKGLVYALKYQRKSPFKLRREIDITRNIPLSWTGRYNLAYDKKGGGRMFIATRQGVYYGSHKQLKGKKRWKKVGKKLPHCKVYGLDYNEKHKVLTIGLLGRGVWRYNLR